jgi:hypothetical protein
MRWTWRRTATCWGRARRWSSCPGLGAGELAGWVAPRAAGHGPDRAQEPAPGQVDRAFRSEWRCLEPVRHKVGRLVLAWVHRPGPAQRARVAGLPAGCRHPRVQVLARVAERLAAFDAQIAEADQRLAACCRGPGSRCCALAVVRAAASGAAVGDPARWPSARQVDEPAACAPPPMPRPAAAMTTPAAGKARSPCGGPCAGSGWAVAAGPGRPRRCRLPAGPSQATRGARQRHGESGQPHRLGHGQRPTTYDPTRWSCASPPAPGRGARLVGWEPDQTPPAIWRTTGHAEASLVPGLRSPSSTRTRSADPLPREVAELRVGPADPTSHPHPTDQHTA